MANLNEIKYLDYAGLELLVSKIKAGDEKALADAKAYVGAIPAEATQTTVIAYLMAEIENAKEAATFDGKASSVTIEDANEYYTATTVEGALAEVKKIADDNASDLTTIKGEGTGSIKKALQDAKDYTDDSIGELKIGETSYATVKSYVDAKDAAIVKLIDATNGDLSTLTTDAKTDVVAAINEVDANADAAKKAADDAQDDVDALETLVGDLPTGEGAPTTVVGYIEAVEAKITGDAGEIQEALDDEIKRATDAEEALGGRIDDVEDLIGEIEEGSTVAAEIAKAEQNAKDYADEIVSDLGSVFNFKGIVDTVEDLPTENIKQGDVYNVKTTERGTSAEYVYITDKGWEELGDVLDLSAYDTRTVAEGKIATAKSEAITAAEGYADSLVGEIKDEEGNVVTVKSYVDGLDSAMDTRVDALEEAIGEGGGVSQQIQTAIEALDATVTNEVEGEDKPDVTVTVVEADGKLTSVTAVVNAKYDAEGAAEEAASAVQGDTESTVADVEAKVDAITSITDEEIKALFTTEEDEVTE